MNVKWQFAVEFRSILLGCSFFLVQAAEGQNDGPQGTTITADVPSTLALTPNNGGISNAWAAPQDLAFTTLNKAAPADLAQNFPALDFNSPNALVMLKTNAISVSVAVSSNLGGLTTIVVRNPQDNVGTTNLPNYSETQGPGTNGGILTPTEHGSFYIVAFKDINGNGIREANETAFVLPLIIVSAEYVSNSDASVGDTTDFQYLRNYPARYLIESLSGGSIGRKPDNSPDGRFASYGAGYTSVPAVAFNPATGGAAGTVTLSGSSVDSFQISNWGAGYTEPPIVIIDPPALPAVWKKSEVVAGSYPVFGGNNPAIKYDAKVLLVGGVDGSLGLDRVYGGWSQQLQTTNQHAKYQNGANIKTVSLTLKQSYAFPLLDRSPAYAVGAGAGTILTTGSKFELEPFVAGTLGRKARITGWDSLTNSENDKELPNGFKLIEIRLQAKFKVFMTLWTNPTAGMTPSRPLGGVLPNPSAALEAGERTYFDVRTMEWEVDDLYTIDAVGAGTRQGAPKSVITNNATFSPTSPAVINQHETRPPRANDGIERVTQ